MQELKHLQEELGSCFLGACEPPGYPSEISQVQEDKDHMSSLPQGLFSEKVKYIEMESEKVLKGKVKEIRVS